MKQTIAEKILSKKNIEGKEVKAGDIILGKPDVILINDASSPLAFIQFKNIGAKKVADPQSVVVVLDHFSPPPSLSAAEDFKEIRIFVQEHGVPNFFEMGSGIEHTLLPERGFIKPGSLIIGGDSHTTTYGAFNAFGTGLGSTDIAVALALGYTWFLVPESQRFEFEGERMPFVSGKDLILRVIKDIGVDGATYQSMEFAGSGLLQFNMDEYMALCNMAVEAGAKAGIVEANENIAKWAVSKFGYLPELVRADEGAEYVNVIKYNLSEINEPLVAKPHSPGNVVGVSEVEGIHVDQVYIGNCANGTLTDLRQAAFVLKGRHVAKGTRLIVVPATQQIYKQAIKEGLIDIFLEAGAVISPPTCGACFGGHMGLLADGEVAITTTNRNFRGRMGSAKAEIYLANAFVAAASAVTGYITNPKKIVNWEEAKKFVYGDHNVT
jgi:3-isopropylmalate/(R)-2-methylmalate dehydratase large subunit